MLGAIGRSKPPDVGHPSFFWRETRFDKTMKTDENQGCVFDRAFGCTGVPTNTKLEREKQTKEKQGSRGTTEYV
ncbi:hypothetical protein [Cohnella faecalis]|uniref:hypothetical protein n=1 Tax=Cohnella faecalis TaxID=2315694 RepID=UPI000E5A1A5F|nr:hypothetical protein [Cohnella faecalis]